MIREEDIEAYGVKQIEKLGGTLEKFVSPNRNKVPDRLSTLPHRPIFFIEFKAPDTIGKFPSNAHERAQHRDHERRRALGQKVYVIGTYEQMDALIEELRDA